MTIPLGTLVMLFDSGARSGLRGVVLQASQDTLQLQLEGRKSKRGDFTRGKKVTVPAHKVLDLPHASVHNRATKRLVEETLVESELRALLQHLVEDLVTIDFTSQRFEDLTELIAKLLDELYNGSEHYREAYELWSAIFGGRDTLEGYNSALAAIKSALRA